MIALAADYLLFELPGGATVPYSSANIMIELSGETAALFDSEFVRHAANAVFHYFRYELERQCVSAAEFASALEKVLSGFVVCTTQTRVQRRKVAVLESDLQPLADDLGKDSELFFFSRLRAELRRQLVQTPHVVRFSGLRACVKRLLGARRWSGRCRQLEEEIVDYLRKCLSAERSEAEFAMVVV